MGQVIGANIHISRRTKFAHQAPIGRPYRTHMDCGTISPNMMTRTVLLIAAAYPPPIDRSRTIGNVSFVMTLPTSNVTSTQCLPLLSRLSTLTAFFFSEPSPDSAITCRYTSSWPMSLQRSQYRSCIRLLLHIRNGQTGERASQQDKRDGSAQIDPCCWVVRCRRTIFWWRLYG